MTKDYMTTRLMDEEAQVAELADALRSGRSSRTGVKVQILSWALKGN